MLPPGSRVIAAVSGGPDSVCLLHVLRELECSVAGVAHVNHQLRGADSEADARFVEELAGSFELPFYSVAAPIAEGNIEQEARRARRDFFRELLARGHADRIALGHTRDDQAETVLFRMMRGSGITGLAGILPITAEGLIRPLLDVGRQEVLGYLRERGIPWREDASNQSEQFARNRIRHTLLPQLEREWNPRLRSILANMAEVAYEEEVRWVAEIAGLAPKCLAKLDGAVEIAVPAIVGLDRATQRRLLRHAIRLAKGNLRGIDYEHIEQGLDLLKRASGRRTLPGVTMLRSYDRILIARAEFGTVPGPLAVRTLGRLSWPAAKPLIHIEISSAAPCDTLKASLEDVELRGWRPGDRYCPAGRTRVVKLKELFQEARVPSWRRPSWPILTLKGRILWARDFGPAAEGPPWTVREYLE